MRVAAKIRVRAMNVLGYVKSIV